MNNLEQEYNNEIDELSKEWKIDTNNISDWYHTFWKLYKHRHHLFIALCRSKILEVRLNKKISELCETITQEFFKCIKSKKHFDWSECEWWFIIQLETPYWQISYHLPNEYWDNCDFIETKDKANEWDWHDSDTVLERLLKI